MNSRSCSYTWITSTCEMKHRTTGASRWIRDLCDKKDVKLPRITIFEEQSSRLFDLFSSNIWVFDKTWYIRPCNILGHHCIHPKLHEPHVQITSMPVISNTSTLVTVFQIDIIITYIRYDSVVPYPFPAWKRPKIERGPFQSQKTSQCNWSHSTDYI